jgi:tRNA A-37 threonylcarbamoyl transferase component Bud32
MHGKGMTRSREGSWKIWFAAGCGQGPTSEAVKHFCEAFSSGSEAASAAVRLVHGGGRSSIYGAEFAGGRYCLKVFKDARLQTRVRTLLGWSKGRHAFRNGLRASEKGIPVPAVYAYAEKRPFGPGMVVMQFLDATQMNLLIEDMLSRGVELTTDPFFIRMIGSFGQFTRNLHQNSICHADFSPRNVLVAMDGDRIRLQLIDLEDVFFSGSVADFRDNIDHFSRKMARYVDQEALAVYQEKFREGYGE